MQRIRQFVSNNFGSAGREYNNTDNIIVTQLIPIPKFVLPGCFASSTLFGEGDL